MALDKKKCREALANLGQRQPIFIDPPAAFRMWLAVRKVPDDVAEFLLGTAVAANIPFPDGCGGMWTPEDIMVLNDQEADIFAGGLLAVGNSTNGDFIVIDMCDDQRQAGFVGHDELARNYEKAKSWAGVREIFAPVADSLDEMLLGMSVMHWQTYQGNAWNGYPGDYCEALSWTKRK